MISLGECVDVEVHGRSTNSAAVEILGVAADISDVVVVFQRSVHSADSVVVDAFDSQNSVSAVEIADDDAFVVQLSVVSAEGMYRWMLLFKILLLLVKMFSLM